MANLASQYLAVVEETGLGDDGRCVTVKSNVVPLIPDLVYPLFDGLIKLAAPAKGDIVFVFALGTAGVHRWYLPIRAVFSSSGDEAMILGDTLVDILGELCDALATSTHGTAVGNTTPPLDAASYATIKSKLATAKSTKTKVE